MRDRLRELKRGLDASPLGALLRDEQRMQQIIGDQMQSAQDPIVREMGRGLADGSATWSDLANTPAYQEKIREGLSALENFDTEAAMTETEAYLASLEDEGDKEPPGGPEGRDR